MTKTTNLLQTAANVSTNDTLRDIKPPVIIRSGWEWVPWALGALALAAIIAAAMWWWRRKRAEAAVEVIVPPHVRARRKLEEALALIAQPVPFVVAVSGTLRTYLEERFEFRAPERTTEEFLYELGDTPLLSSRQKQSLCDFLTRCDLVKFAKYEPGEPELRDLHAAALHLVQETEPLAETTTTENPAPAPTSQTA